MLRITLLRIGLLTWLLSGRITAISSRLSGHAGLSGASAGGCRISFGQIGIGGGAVPMIAYDTEHQKSDEPSQQN